MSSVVSVCYSVCLQGGSHVTTIQLTTIHYPAHQICSTWTSPYRYLPNMFKLVHYEAQTVSKWVVGIQLKCLLVVYALSFVTIGYTFDSVDMVYAFSTVPSVHAFGFVTVVYVFGL